MASPRANRFVECVFTAPVSRGDWLAAKFLVLLTQAAAYYIALFPAMLVYASHVGVPFLLHKYLLWTPGILLAEISIGSLIGILFIGRSVLAPIGTAMGILLAYVIFIPMQEVMVAQGNGATRTGHITLSSPAVLLKNALGFAFGGRVIPSATKMTWISLAVIVFGSMLLAAWVFLRAQGVETWETTRSQRWIIAVAVIAIALFPAIFAETAYDAPAPAPNNAPSLRISARQGANAALVPPGAAFPRRCCSPILNWDRSALATGQSRHADLLIALPVDTASSVTNLRATLEGGDGLGLTAAPLALNQPAPPLETRNYPNDSGPQMPDGSRLTSGWFVRIPVTLDPENPWDIGEDRYAFNIAATYNVPGDTMPHSFEEHAGIAAQVPGAWYQMALATCILPLICFGAAFARWRRTR
jgi:hypothetical protein